MSHLTNDDLVAKMQEKLFPSSDVEKILGHGFNGSMLRFLLESYPPTTRMEDMTDYVDALNVIGFSTSKLLEKQNFYNLNY